MEMDMVKYDEIKNKLVEIFKDNPDKFGDWIMKTVYNSQLFPYQRKFLKDRSKRIIFLAGRQCLQKDEFVYMKGDIKKVCEVSEGDIQIDGSVVKDIHVFSSKCYKVKFYGGIEIKVSEGHRFLTDCGWKYIEDLKKSDYVEFRFIDKYVCDLSELGVDVKSIDELKRYVYDTIISRGCFSINSDRGFYLMFEDKKCAVQFQVLLWYFRVLSSIKEFSGKYLVMINTRYGLEKLLEFLESVNDYSYYDLIEYVIERYVDLDNLIVCEDKIYLKVVGIEECGEDEFVGWNAVPSKEIISYCGMVNHNCGKSTVCAIRALWKAWCFPNQTILVVSRTGRQSKILAKRIRDILAGCKILDKDKVIHNTEQLEFSNGSVIYFLPGDPDNIRGFTANTVIIDEAAFVPDDLFTVVEPCVMATQGEIIMISSPFKKQGYFYEAVMSGLWSVHKVTCYDNPLITKEDIEKFRLQHTLAEFKREMLAEFCDDDSESYVPQSAIEEVMSVERHYVPQEGWEYVVGVDIARFGNDYTAFAIIGKKVDEDLTNSKLYFVNLYMYKKKRLTYTIERLKHLNEVWKPKMIMIDSNGLGAGVFDILRDELGSVVVDSSEFSKGEKRVKAYMDLRNFILNKKLMFFKPDSNDFKVEIFSHFNNVEIEYDNRTGRVKIVKKPNGNDDIVDALVYGLQGWIKLGIKLNVKASVIDNVDVDKILSGAQKTLNSDVPSIVPLMNSTDMSVDNLTFLSMLNRWGGIF